MDLDDYNNYANVDENDMLSEIDSLPTQLEKAWRLAAGQKFDRFCDCSSIVLAGMGGSAIGADLIASYLENQIKIPIVIHRNYGLPFWTAGKNYCVIVSSHSGNTEEALSSLDEAIKRDCSVIAVTTGGQLHQYALENCVPVVRFSHAGQPRSAVGFNFGILLSILCQIGLVGNQEGAIQGCLDFMKEQQKRLVASVFTADNPAKQLASRLTNRFITVYAADFLIPVARRWKGQLNELVKVWAQFDVIPEANHNSLAGILEPREKLKDQYAIFLNSNLLLQKNQIRIEMMEKELVSNGIASEVVMASGASRLAQMWFNILLGDYMAYYLAILYDQDPTPIQPIIAFKKKITESFE